MTHCGNLYPRGSVPLLRKGQIGMEIMHLLTGLTTPSTQGVEHIYDLRSMEVDRKAVVPEPDCPVCGNLAHAGAAAVKETADG